MENQNDTGRWDASAFFEKLVERSPMARHMGVTFARVSSLQGFEEALAQMLEATALVCVSDVSNGSIALSTSPRTRRVKTVFLAMRHPADDMEARQHCFDDMRELFRRFMSVLMQERTRLQQQCIYLSPDITYSEIERYFFSGAACAFFQITVDVMTDLRFDPEEWGGADLTDLLSDDE